MGGCDPLSLATDLFPQLDIGWFLSSWSPWAFKFATPNQIQLLHFRDETETQRPAWSHVTSFCRART